MPSRPWSRWLLVLAAVVLTGCRPADQGTRVLPGVPRPLAHGTPFSPDGRCVVLCSDTGGEATIWDMPGRRRAVHVGDGGPRRLSASFSPDGRYLLTIQQPDPAAASTTITLWSPDGRCLARGEEPGGYVEDLVLDPAGRTCFTTSSRGAITLRSLPDLRVLQRWRGTRPGWPRVEAAARRNVAVLALPGRREVLVVDTSTGATVRTLTAPWRVRRAWVDPAGGIVAAAGEPRGVAAWELNTGSRLATSGGTWHEAHAPIDAEAGILVAAGGERELSVQALRGRRDTRTIELPDEVRGYRLAGGELAVWTARELRVIDPTSGEVRWTAAVDPREAEPVTVCPATGALVICTPDGGLQRWEPGPWRAGGKVVATGERLHDALWSATGASVAARSDDREPARTVVSWSAARNR